MTKKLILALYILLAAASHAQESNSVFNFLEMPVSAHSTALGGRNISLIEDDASLVFSNPALLSSVSDKTLNLNFMTYLQGCNVGSAAFVKILGERSTMGVTAQYAHYGTMDEITADNVTVGSFSAMDMAERNVCLQPERPVGRWCHWKIHLFEIRRLFVCGTGRRLGRKLLQREYGFLVVGRSAQPGRTGKSIR